MNKRLLGALEDMPNVKFFFNHKLTGADFRNCKAWFEAKAQPTGQDDHGRAPEIQVDFDLMIGADGAHSATRYHMMKFLRMDYSQKYIDTLWCEFQITPREERPDDPASKFAISPNHLHIWPGKEFMFIAIPSEVRILNCPQSLPFAIAYSGEEQSSGRLTSVPGWIIHVHPVPPSSPFLPPRERSVISPRLLQPAFPGRDRTDRP